MEFVKENRSRGYSGWVEIDGDNYYCRSSIEFIYLHHYLNKYKKENGYIIKMEDKIFFFNGLKYKPDIFLYHNNILIKIIEIKYNKKQFNDNFDKYNQFEEYAKKINIEYEIQYKNNKIITPFIKDKLKKWIESNRSINIDGKNNPMYGMVHSEETKKLIGLKTKERFKDIEYVEYFKSRVKKTEEQKENSRNSALKRHFIIKKEKYGEIVDKKCIICGDYFKDYEKNKKITCKNSCSFKLKYSEGKIKINPNPIKSYSTKIIKYLYIYKDDIIKINNFIEFYEYVNKLKKKSLIPKTLGLSENTINKYFKSFEAFKKEINKFKYEN